MTVLDTLYGLVLESGERWGAAAMPAQLADARAVLEPGDGPRRHWIGTPKGSGKTDGAAAMGLVELVEGTFSPTTPSYAAAADREQASLFLDSLRGYVERMGWQSVIDVQTYRAVHRNSGASIEVLAADSAGAHGLRPSRLFVDELANWYNTKRSRDFFEALWAGLVKVHGSVGVIATTAGTYGHFSHEIYRQALAEKTLWRVSMVHEVAPWIDPKLVEAERRRMTESAWLRLWKNEWAANDEALVSGDDLEAALRDDDSPIPPVEGVRYVISLDVGTVNDRTVVLVAHKEGSGEDERIIVDRLWRWQGTRKRAVDLDSVEAQVVEAHNRYPGEIVLDPHQGVQMLQRLQKRGIRASKLDFTTQSVGRFAMSLLTLLRAHRLSLPRDPVLVEELANVRIVENGAGVPRLQHYSGRHDDQAVACALACYRLTDGAPPVRRGARMTHAGPAKPISTEGNPQPAGPPQLPAGYWEKQMGGIVR